MSIRLGIVYHAFDTTNGKAYIGQTRGTIEERRKEHMRERSGCRVFKNALHKRPWAFTWTVLTTCLKTQQELDDAEIYWGIYFDTLAPNGYNLKLGRGRTIWSTEEKQRHSAIAAVVQNRPEVKARRNAAVKESWSRASVKEKHVVSSIRAHNTPEVKQRHSDAAKISNARPDVKRKREITNASLATRSRRSAAQKARRECERSERKQ